MSLGQKTLLLGPFLVLAATASADVVNLSGAENSRNIAEIQVEEDRIEVLLEIFPADLEPFVDALPDDWFEDPGAREDRGARLARFAREAFGFRADGVTVPIEVKSVERRMRIERYSPLAGRTNPYTGQPIPGPPEDKRVVAFELSYTLPGNGHPAVLEIMPPLLDDGFASIPLGFTLHHEGIMVVDFSALTQPQTLNLDWDDPWYTRFEDPQLRRWQLSGMATYLYIEPYEVRHEMLVRVRDVMPLLHLGLRDPAWIGEDEFRRVESAVGDFLLAHSNVTIDGERGEGTLGRINFVRYERRQTLFLTEPERLAVDQARLGVVITYPHPGIANEVTMTWDLFTDRVRDVPANAIDPAGPFPTTLTVEDPVHVWKNYLKRYTIPSVEPVPVADGHLPTRLPVLGLAVLLVGFTWAVARRGRGPRTVGIVVVVTLILAAVAYPVGRIDRGRGLDEEQAQALVVDLLRNVYLAMEGRSEEDVYDQLAVTVDGDLLTEVYLDNRRAFEVQQAGGAQAKVERVEVERADPGRKGRGYEFDTAWLAEGSVGHWGHLHYRTNRYQARITAEPREGSWRITGLDILDEERVDPGG